MHKHGFSSPMLNMLGIPKLLVCCICVSVLNHYLHTLKALKKWEDVRLGTKT